MKNNKDNIPQEDTAKVFSQTSMPKEETVDNEVPKEQTGAPETTPQKRFAPEGTSIEELEKEIEDKRFEINLEYTDEEFKRKLEGYGCNFLNDLFEHFRIMIEKITSLENAKAKLQQAKADKMIIDELNEECRIKSEQIEK